MTPTTPPASPELFRKPHAPILKMGAIMVLGLLLLIPLVMVHSVLAERLARRDAAIKEITATWGNPQVIFGPVLIVPYTHVQKAWREQTVGGRVERVEVNEQVRARAFFLPAVLKAEGQLSPTRLHRGIYEAVVYDGTVMISGSFAYPSFAEWKVDPQQILWDEAELAISITDLRGARESLNVTLGGQVYPLRPGGSVEGFTSGLHTPLTGLASQPATIPFEMRVALRGSRSLRVAPVGVNNEVQLASTWPDPSFQGAFLPTDRKVGPEGFSARWQMSSYGRSFPQQWTEHSPLVPAAVTASLFGVDLVPVVDSYRYVERAIKYGVLPIALLFTAFFLFEVIAAVRIHPFQYTLVGMALCLFYLALLALSEVVSFGAAYWAGAAAATLMISLYSARTLCGGQRAGVVAGGLPAVYGFLFVILRLQDYSLLIGTAGLFVALGLVMYVTRKIDWYAGDNR